MKTLEVPLTALLYDTSGAVTNADTATVSTPIVYDSKAHIQQSTPATLHRLVQSVLLQIRHVSSKCIVKMISDTQRSCNEPGTGCTVEQIALKKVWRDFCLYNFTILQSERGFL